MFQKIIDSFLVKGMERVGELFSQEEIFIPEVLIASMGMNQAMELLKPLLIKGNTNNKGTVVIGTVAGDIHEIGKNLVAIMLQGAGYEVINLGVDVSSESFIQAVKEHNAQFVGFSTMLTTTMMEIPHIIEDMKQQGLRDKVKILIGGAPITDKWTKEVGADGFGQDGTAAVNLVNGFAF